MQLYTIRMIKYTQFVITFLLAIIAIGANAQSSASLSTTSSPYTMYGIGTINPQLLPQSIGMGGIATAINKLSGFNNINPLNPASYGAINFTTFDAGITSNINFLSQTRCQLGVSKRNKQLILNWTIFTFCNSNQ